MGPTVYSPRLTEILETFPRVFCFPKSRINENGGNNTARQIRVILRKIIVRQLLTFLRDSDSEALRDLSCICISLYALPSQDSMLA